MNMKNASTRFFAVILFSAIAIASLRAQTNAGSGPTNAAAPAAVDDSPAVQPSPVHVHVPGIHIEGSPFHEAGFTQSLALMIPIIAIVMGCCVPIAIVGLSLYFRHRKNQMLHETVRTMVEKGVPVPPEMFNQTERELKETDYFKRPRNDLRSGVMLTCMGIGIVLFIGKPGWIILFLGVAFLVVAAFEKKNKSDDQPPKP
jgi:hypothetical protein